MFIQKYAPPTISFLVQLCFVIGMPMVYKVDKSEKTVLSQSYRYELFQEKL